MINHALVLETFRNPPETGEEPGLLPVDIQGVLSRRRRDVMTERESIAIVEDHLVKFRAWKQRNRMLWDSLKTEQWREPTGHPSDRGLTPLDHRLEGWLNQSRTILSRELAKAIATIREGESKSDPHPSMLKFGLLGEQSIGALHETVHTKLLAWFLDPSKPHGFDDVLLRAVCKLTCLYEHVKRETLDDVVVITEHLTEGINRRRSAGRIDIFVEGRVAKKPISLWIEAKTMSDEGNRQLARYSKAIENWRKKRGNGSIAASVFLTPDGRDPKNRSNRSARESKWQSLDYPRLALSLWRAAALKSNASGRDLLRLYLASVLRDFGGWPQPLDAAAAYDVIDDVKGGV